MHDESFMDYREFATSEEAHAWANEHYSDLMFEDRFGEARDKIIEYTGNTYIPINSVLRVAPDYGSEAYDKCNFGDREDYRDDIMLLHDTLSQFPLKENIVAYRAITWRSLFRLCKGVPRKGIIFKEKAFASTSLVRSSVLYYSKEHNCPCILKILLPKGLSGAFVSNYADYDRLDENEFLIVPNSRFEIVAIHPFSRVQRIVCRALLL